MVLAENDNNNTTKRLSIRYNWYRPIQSAMSVTVANAGELYTLACAHHGVTERRQISALLEEAKADG